MSREETLRRLGAPACENCGAIQAPRRAIRIAVGANMHTTFSMRICLGCDDKVLGRRVYPAWGGVSFKPTLLEPYGLITQVEPLPKNNSSIGIEMRQK